ncbi:hypothetical protein J6590_065243 [Homalodisca vitripennis]|nr:hypothetical protein J6590_065243 [Homalodisca vitripennis]
MHLKCSVNVGNVTHRQTPVELRTVSNVTSAAKYCTSSVLTCDTSTELSRRITFHCEWMEVAKSKKALDAIHLSSRFEMSPVYVNDSVHQFITVLNQAKKMVREQLAYAWVKEGKQLVMTETDGLVKL